MRKRHFRLSALLCVVLYVQSSAADRLTYEIVATYPHDPNAYTQGLYYEEGILYEGTGLYGESSVRHVELETGEVLRQHDLSEFYFGEGITLFDGKLYQLSWQRWKGFIYDPESLEQIGEFRYRGEGWGLTHNETHLIVSNGSSYIQFLDPNTFKVDRQIQVQSGNHPVEDLNELEYIDGYIYSNVWWTDTIVKIDPKDGQVVATLDLSELFPERPKQEDAVLNGIAYIESSDTLLVTGKLWSQLFEIRISSPEVPE